MVERAEQVLREIGLRTFRVRHHDTLARIEVDPAEIGSLARPPIRELIVSRLRAIGYAYVTLDLQGFRSGSMNEVLQASSKPPAPK